MAIQDVQFVIYVKDLGQSIDFYSKTFQVQPENGSDSYKSFSITPNIVLGITTETEVVKYLGTHAPHPMIANGIPRFEIYIHSEDAESYFYRSIQAGAVCLNEFERRPWGHIVAYVMDLDGNILAFAKK